MTPALDPDDDAPVPPTWWLAAARQADDDRHAGPNAEQADEDAEPRVFGGGLPSPGARR